MSKLLLPFSFLYILVVLMRNFLFNIKILRQHRVSVPVISVGNISAGGVGKTPVVELLISHLINKKKKLALVSRGYGRKSKGTILVSDGEGKFSANTISGDEPFQIAKKFSNIIVVADEKRVRGALLAQNLGAEIILLDDAFQHRYLHRDFDLVVMTADEILSGDLFLPAGNRREPLIALRRADVLFITRCESKEHFYTARNCINRHFNAPVKFSAKTLENNSKIAIIGLKTEQKCIKNAFSGKVYPIEYLQKKRGISFSGLGNPAQFEQLLRILGLNIICDIRFNDHHWFSEKDLAKIIKEKVNKNADFLITTEKDAIRLENFASGILKNEQVFVLEIQQKIIEGEEIFTEIISLVCGK